MATADELLAIARRHLGEKYVFGAPVPKGNPAWVGPWDCAEFCSWCVFQVTGGLFGCLPRKGNPDTADAYTGYWAEDARKFGKLITIGQAAATPGAFLLREPSGKGGHIAISSGDGTTIEAHSTKRGVIEGRVAPRRWDTGVLVPGIEVAMPAVPMPVTAPGLVLRLKQPRMTGRLVKAMQRALRDVGCNPGAIDGEYGPQTAAAVRAFQLQSGLSVDGEVGKVTAKKLGLAWY